jgi:hypothetical protein
MFKGSSKIAKLISAILISLKTKKRGMKSRAREKRIRKLRILAVMQR